MNVQSEENLIKIFYPDGFDGFLGIVVARDVYRNFLPMAMDLLVQGDFQDDFSILAEESLVSSRSGGALLLIDWSPLRLSHTKNEFERFSRTKKASKKGHYLPDGHGHGCLPVSLKVLGVLPDVDPHFVADAHVGGVAFLALDADGVGRGLGELQGERPGRITQLLHQLVLELSKLF